MPKRTDIHTVLIIGAGPIVIGQACEFDYSGAQACKALRAEGYRVVLVNSNPATIMTDPDMADATYIEPITPEFVEKIIARERPNVPRGPRLRAAADHGRPDRAQHRARRLRKRGTLEKYDIELIGASADAIDKAEDRELFRQAMMKIGLEVPKGVTLKGELRHKKDARRQFMYDSAEQSDHGACRRNSQTRVQGRAGRSSACPPSSGRPSRSAAPAAASPTTARNSSSIVERGLDASPTNEVLIEESVLGWKEYRDGGRARPRRQRHHHLLHREHRSDGRAHRRFHHRRPGADADRQGISAHAHRLASRCCARSAWRPAARTCSSRSIPPTAAWSSSR